MKVVGFGNEFRHDDAAGLIVARRLRERGFAAEECGTDAAALLEFFREVDHLIVVDTAVSGAAPGSIHRIDAKVVSTLPCELFKHSTHAFGVLDALELGRILGILPRRVELIGVEAGDVGPGLGLSPEVECALAAIVDEIVALIEMRKPTEARGVS